MTAVVLFDHGKASSVGYGKVMLEQLLEGPITFVVDGHAKTIGGKEVTGDLIEAALGHMQEWTRLLYKTIQAEVPHFELTQSFVVLHLGNLGNELRHQHAAGVKFNALGMVTGGEDLSEYETNLQRLGKFLGCPSDDEVKKLQQVIEEVRPLATQLHRQKGLAFHEAWATATEMKIKNARSHKDKLNKAGYS